MTVLDFEVGGASMRDPFSVSNVLPGETPTRTDFEFRLSALFTKLLESPPNGGTRDGTGDDSHFPNMILEILLIIVIFCRMSYDINPKHDIDDILMLLIQRN